METIPATVNEKITETETILSISGYICRVLSNILELFQGPLQIIPILIILCIVVLTCHRRERGYFVLFVYNYTSKSSLCASAKQK